MRIETSLSPAVRAAHAEHLRHERIMEAMLAEDDKFYAEIVKHGGYDALRTAKEGDPVWEAQERIRTFHNETYAPAILLADEAETQYRQLLAKQSAEEANTLAEDKLTRDELIAKVVEYLPHTNDTDAQACATAIVAMLERRQASNGGSAFTDRGFGYADLEHLLARAVEEEEQGRLTSAFLSEDNFDKCVFDLWVKVFLVYCPIRGTVADRKMDTPRDYVVGTPYQIRLESVWVEHDDEEDGGYMELNVVAA